MKVKTIAIVSLSGGILGEAFIKHELELGLSRLERYGVKVKMMEHTLKGLDYLKDHPEKRAEDLLCAFRDPEIDMILCAIGGEDTYRLLPYLFDHGELKDAVCDKIFLGFSDSTVNHLMLHKVGLNTFYGQSFLSDVCELDREMLPYTERFFRELVTTGGISEIDSSDVWYESRTDFGEDQLGVPLKAHKNQGFELLQGAPVFSGKILGGCLDTIYDIFDNTRHVDSPAVFARYEVFPTLDDWKGKILLLETSEEQMPPEKYRKAITQLKNEGLFEVINGILVGKPMDERYYEEYKQILIEVVDNPSLSIVYNLNVGHALPRCIVPFGVKATVDVAKQTIVFE